MAEIRLRGHHVLCLLTYIGRGYSPAFILSMDRVAARLKTGEAARIVEGPDDLCAPLQAETHKCAGHCLSNRSLQRDALALQAIGEALGQALQVGSVFAFTLANIQTLRLKFRHAPAFRAACDGCEWHSLCDEIAASGFEGAKL